MNPKPMLTAIAFALLTLLCLLLAACRPPVDTPTPTVTPTPSLLANVAGPLTATLTMSPTVAQPCPAPSGWAIHTIAAGDTLFALAAATGSTVEAIMAANCLESDVIVIGFSLALPILPPPTLTPAPSATPCGPPNDWVIYLVQPGDTLYELAQQTGVTTSAVQNANCLASLEIFVGRGLYLPFQPGGVAIVDQGSGGGNVGVTPPPDCPTAFVCIQPEDNPNPRPLTIGQPADPRGLCYDRVGNPIAPEKPTIRVGYRSQIPLPREGERLRDPLTRGEWVFFAACAFPSIATVTMRLTYDGAVIPLSTQTVISGTQQFVVAAWPILCDLSTEGNYELMAQNGVGNNDQLTFQLDAPREQILAVPYQGVPGPFHIYFCNYASSVGTWVDIELMSHPTKDALGRTIHAKQRIDKIFITDAGWGQLRLMLPIGNEASSSYFVRNRTNRVDQELIEIR